MLLLVALAWSPSLRAAPLVLSEGPVHSGGGLSILHDAGGALSFEQARAQAFRPTSSVSHSLGFVRGAVWARLDLENRTNRSDWRIVLAAPRVENVRFFAPSGRDWAETRTGAALPFRDRPYPSRNFIFPLSLESGARTSVYLRLESETSMQIPIEVWTAEGFHESDRNEMLFLGVLFGAHALLLVYNLAIGLFVRTGAFIVFALFVLVATIFYVSAYGLSYQFFWPDWPLFNRNANMVLLNLVVAAALQFTRTLLCTGRHPRLDRLLISYALAALASTLLLLVLPYRVAAQINIAVALFTFVPVALTTYRGIRDRQPAAYYYMAAMGCYALGAVTFAGMGFGWLPAVIVVRYSFLVGATIAAAVLSLAVASAVRALVIDREAALEAERFKSRFLWVMSHEIRTPLTAVVGMTDLLAGTQDEQERRHYLDILRESGARLEHLVNQVLDYARIEQGRIELLAVPFRPGEVLNGAVHLLRPAAAKKNVQLIVVNAIEHLHLSGDAARISQILLNLIGNAVKFTQQGSITVRASAGQADGQTITLHFSIEDTGVGIPPEQRQVVFHSFVQATSPTRRPEGTGLGLAIVSELVAAMGGHIEIQDNPGGGTIFLVSLPLALPGASSRAAPEIPSGVVPSLRILVAEDDENSALLVRTILTRAGHDVELCGNGREAVEAFSRSRFDLVLLDLQMPEMDGLEAARLIRAADRPDFLVRLYAISANALPRDLAECRAAGFTGHVAKPYRAADLQRLVAAVAIGVPSAADFKQVV